MSRIIQLSDIHFGGENSAAVAWVADFIRAEPFDLLVTTGDITALGSHAEFEQAHDWFEALPGPKLFTPGNHDTPWAGIIDRIVSPFGRYRRCFGPAEADGFTAPTFAVQALNTSRGIQPRANWSKGQIAPRQVRQAIARLEGRAEEGALRIVACHHPLVEMTAGPMTGKVWGGHDAAKAFAEAGIDAILTGHLHVPFALHLPFADERTYAIGCGTLSLRERGFAPSFNLIDIEPGCIKITALGFKGARFEPERTWALDRRPH